MPKKKVTLLDLIQSESELKMTPKETKSPPKKKSKPTKTLKLKTSKPIEKAKEIKEAKESKESKKSKKPKKSKKAKVTFWTSLSFRFGKSKKTSTLVQITPVKNLLSPKSAHALQEKFKTHEDDGFTPVKEITKFSVRGTPEEIKSEHDNILYLNSRNGPFFSYTSEKPPEESKVEKKLMDDPDFAIKTKTVSVTITKKLLKLAAQKILENKGKRCKPQNVVMGESATEHTHAAGISLTKKMEWGHLIAHRFLSDLSQVAENMAAITNHANTEMIPVEDFIVALAFKDVGKIKIVVTAHLIGETDIASSIHYDVHVGGRIIPFVFEGQQANKPDIFNKKSMEIFCDILISHNKLKGKKASKPLTSSPSLPMFFSKSALAKKSSLKKAAHKVKKVFESEAPLKKHKK